MYDSLTSATIGQRIFPLICMALMLFACDRPFVPPAEPIIEVIAPGDPARLLFSPEVEFRVRASSFRDIGRVEVEGTVLEFDESAGNWFGMVSLTPGLNELEVTAFDIEDFSGTRTLTLAYLQPSFDSDAPQLPSPWSLGGHTATLLNDGSLLVTGGSPNSFQNAVSNAFLLPEGSENFLALGNNMRNPRYGHTASMLPDGRVLILGGSSTASPSMVGQMIENAEIYDPASQTFTTVGFDSNPLRRTEHVTFITQGPTALIVDVYGGLGQDPVQGGDRLFSRPEIATYQLRGNTLFPSSNFSDSQILPAYGISSTLLSDSNPGDLGRFMVSGATFLESGSANINFSINFDETPIRVVILEEMLTPRIQHASVSLEPGLVAVFGGFQGFRTNATSSTEIFVELNNRFSSIDSRVSTVRRFSHTATKLPSNRILILGGFDETGDAITESEYFSWGLQQ